jgi:hypothetical protein
MQFAGGQGGWGKMGQCGNRRQIRREGGDSGDSSWKSPAAGSPAAAEPPVPGKEHLVRVLHKTSIQQILGGPRHFTVNKKI